MDSITVQATANTLTAAPTRETTLKESVTAKASWFARMVESMTVSGRTAFLMAKAKSSIAKETITKATSKMARDMAKERLSRKRVISTKATG